MAFEGHLCMTRIGIPTFLSKSTMQKDRVKSGDLHPWNLTNWYPTSADAEGVTFSKPGLLSMLDFQRVIPAWTFFYLQYWILASIRNTLVCCHHIIYCIYIYSSCCWVFWVFETSHWYVRGSISVPSSPMLDVTISQPIKQSEMDVVSSGDDHSWLTMTHANSHHPRKFTWN